jgi:hypothetical protein
MLFYRETMKKWTAQTGGKRRVCPGTDTWKKVPLRDPWAEKGKRAGQKDDLIFDPCGI